MTRLYLIRHGETNSNKEGRFQGRLDCDLSDEGREQVEQLAKRLENAEFDVVYTSPLKRARETAEALNRKRRAPVVVDEGITEIGFGSWEGRMWNDLVAERPEQIKLWLETPHLFQGDEGGESMAASYQRVASAFSNLVERNQGKTIIAVSHGASIRNYLCFISGKGVETLKAWPIVGNTAVCCIEFDRELNPKIVYINDTSHLG